MRVLFDTNVVLDLLLNRAPFADASGEVLSRAESGEISGYLCATTVTTLHYLLRKELGGERALGEVRKLLAVFEIAPVNRPVLASAMDLKISDFEDAVLHEAARQVGAQAIVSRNRSDFRGCELPVYVPEELNRAFRLRTDEVHEGSR